MQIAIVSTDGERVNEHFGKAERFLIYEVDALGRTLLGERKIVPLSTGDPNHPFDELRFGKVAAALTCRQLYCVKIGERPAAELRKLGIEPVIYEGQIAAITI
jgi:hypothetical protein